SYASVWTSRDAGCTSRKVPVNPNSLPSRSLRQRQRNLPPTRTSISHTGIDHPGGPSSQRCTSRGSVYALYTSARGALHDRVTFTSRSLGRTTCAFSIVVVMFALLVIDLRYRFLILRARLDSPGRRCSSSRRLSRRSKLASQIARYFSSQAFASASG